MLSRILDWFRGGAVLIQGTDKLTEGQIRKIDIGDPLADGKEVLLCRMEGQLYAIDAVCPHDNGRIAAGELAQGKYLVCPLHFYKFDPVSGANIGSMCSPAKTYKVREKGADCEILGAG